MTTPTLRTEPAGEPARGPAGKRRGGFTLIEVLVVISIIGILAALATAAYFGVLSSANRTITETVMNTLFNAVRDRQSQFFSANKDANITTTLRRRDYDAADLALRIAVESPVPAPMTVDNNPDPPISPSTIEESRFRLIYKLAAQRAEFPQQFIDFLPSNVSASLANGSSNLTYTGLVPSVETRSAQQAILDAYLRALTDARAIPPLNDNGTATVYTDDTYFTTTNVAPVLHGSIPAATLLMPPNHKPETESSECLYLMLTAAKGLDQTFSADEIPRRFIK
ncbi:MAG: type II secretion system protein, partial [Planctomycetia bacterium]